MNKSKIATLAFLVATTATGICGEITIAGVVGSRVAIPSGTNNDTLTIKSEANSEYVVNNSTTFKSISVVNGTSAGDLNIYGSSVTVDINSSTDVNALTANNVFMFYQNWYFQNSIADSKAVANITLAKLDVLSYNGTSQVDQSINFQSIKANVNVSGLSTFGNDYYPSESTIPHTADLNIGYGANVTWNGAIRFAEYGALNVWEQGSFTQNGNVTLAAKSASNAGGIINIVEGGTYTIKSGSITMNKGSNLNIAGTLSTSSNLTFDGNGIVTSTGTLQQTAGELKITDSSVSLSGSARWEIGSKLTIGSSTGKATLTTTDTSKILLTTGGKVMVLDSNSTLNLGTKNAIVGYDTTTGQESTIAVVISGDTSHTLNISANQEFMYFNLLAGSAIDITITDGAKLRFTDGKNLQFGNNSSMRIFDYKDEQVWVGTNDSVREKIEQYVTLYDAEKNLLGNATVVNGWIALAVPEPAEWAMILGSLALGFAIYRRRK